MSIRINKNTCVGCSGRVEVCPGNLIKLNGDKKADIRHERDCWEIGRASCRERV